jgi:hypothetical protein
MRRKSALPSNAGIQPTGTAQRVSVNWIELLDGNTKRIQRWQLKR